MCTNKNAFAIGILIALLAALTPLMGQAQGVHTPKLQVTSPQSPITGRIISSDGSPIKLATVTALDAEGNVLDGAVTDSAGRYTLSKTGHANRLHMSILGYEARTLPLHMVQSEIILIPSDSHLDTIVIEGKARPIRLAGHSLIAGITGTPLADLPSATDLLARLPFVSVERDGIRIQGRGTPLLYIGHRRAELDEVRILDPKSIREVEVILIPGVEYPADAPAIIRITLREQDGSSSLGGRLTSSLMQQMHLGHRQLGSLSYHGSKLSVDVALSYGKTFYDEDAHLETTLLDTNPFFTQIDFSEAGTSTRSSLRGSMVYQFSSNHELGAKIFAHNTYRARHTTTEHNAEIYIAQTLSERYTGTMIQSTPHAELYLMGDLYYYGLIRRGWTMLAEASLTSTPDDWSTQERTMHHTYPNTSTRTVHTETHANRHIYSAKITNTIDLLGGKMLLGGEYNHSYIDQQFDVRSGTNLVPNAYDRTEQDNLALFASWAGTITDQLRLSAGVRTEQARLAYSEGKPLNKLYDPSQWHLFPTLSVTYASRGLQLTLDYNSRITRPSYRDLSGSYLYINDHTLSRGNPELKPLLTSSLSLLASYNDWTLEVKGTRLRNQFIHQVYRYPNAPNVSIYMPTNHTYNSLSADAIWSHQYGVWKPLVTVSCARELFAFDGFSYDRPSWSLSTSHELSLPAEWSIWTKLDLSTTGHSRGTLSYGCWSMDLGATKKLGKRWTLSLECSDLLTTGQTEWRITNRYTDSYKLANSNYPSITLSATYRFDIATATYRGGNAGSAERSRI